MKSTARISKWIGVVLLLMLPLALSSCHKKCLPDGQYLFSFAGSYTESGVVQTSNQLIVVNVTGRTGTSIQLNGNIELKKDGKKVTGTFSMGNYNTVTIDGECDKKNGKDFIEGEYTAEDVQGHIISGRFSIEPN